MRLRARGPSGVTTLELPDAASVGDLRREIARATSLPAFDLKLGYPPTPLDLDQFADDLKLADTGLRLHGEQLIAQARDVAPPLAQPLRNPPPVAPPPLQPSASTPGDADPPEIPLPARNGTLVLRVMADDNSCLFRALSAATLGNLDSMHELRSLVASAIRADPATYTEAVLDKPPDRYCAWISRDDSWGGAIELSILSQHFGLEIASISVQDGRVDRFNEGAPTRCLLVYSGIHYDVIALSPSDPPHTRADLPPDLDQKVFDADDDLVLQAALLLCTELRKRHYYTDTAGFSVRCNDCGWQGKGERDAVGHASSTGHYNFGES